jgi:hypothetical protein
MKPYKINFLYTKDKLSIACCLLLSDNSVLDFDKELQLSELRDIFNIESSPPLSVMPNKNII